MADLGEMARLPDPANQQKPRELSCIRPFSGRQRAFRKAHWLLGGAFGLAGVASLWFVQHRRTFRRQGVEANGLSISDWGIPKAVSANFSGIRLSESIEQLSKLWDADRALKLAAQLLPSVHAAEERKPSPEPAGGDVFSMREKRFLDFASLVYKGQVYMTPQDFLLSVTQEESRERLYRVEVEESLGKKWMRNTPRRSRGSLSFFRGINEQGFISYVEYLFLLCILTEPKSGFSVAFRMFDVDGNDIVDKHEFMVLTKLFMIRGPRKSIGPQDTVTPEDMPRAESGNFIWNEEEMKKGATETTLLVHLFGQKGTDSLNYKDFVKFTENLQREVLDMEFQEYAKGMKTISEVEFARILLRYTTLSAPDKEDYLLRIKRRIKEPKGITFDDYCRFSQFLNNLDDFILMMKFYVIGDNPVGKADFHRAVNICAGVDVSSHVIDTIYALLDVDDDGCLSQAEFISIMKSRLKRGLRTHLAETKLGGSAFKSCLKHEVNKKEVTAS